MRIPPSFILRCFSEKQDFRLCYSLHLFSYGVWRFTNKRYFIKNTQFGQSAWQSGLGLLLQILPGWWVKLIWMPCYRALILWLLERIEKKKNLIKPVYFDPDRTFLNKRYVCFWNYQCQGIHVSLHILFTEKSA